MHHEVPTATEPKSRKFNAPREIRTPSLLIRRYTRPSGASRTNTSQHNLADTSRRHNTPKADPKRLAVPPLSHHHRKGA